MVLDGPVDLTVGEVIKPLEEESPEWIRRVSCLPSHHFP